MPPCIEIIAAISLAVALFALGIALRHGLHIERHNCQNKETRHG